MGAFGLEDTLELLFPLCHADFPGLINPLRSFV